MRKKRMKIFVDTVAKGNISSIDSELLAVIYSLDSFRLFILNKPEFTCRTDCEAIVKFFHRKNEKKSSTRRWLNFVDRIIGNGYKVNFEYIKGKDNNIADNLSRLINSDGKLQQ